MKICTIDACDIAVFAAGLCSGHYHQKQRGVAFHPVTPRKHKVGSQVPWLHAHVSYKGDGCLTWPFSFQKDGRGQVTMSGRTKQAHRVMCELAHGLPPTPLHEAAHLCGKGHLGCVNPKHLAWKTSKENKADQIGHGTRLWGERNTNARLIPAQVYFIREFAEMFSHKHVGFLFEISEKHVGAIVNRRAWSHI